MLSQLLRSGNRKFGGILARQTQANIISHPNNLITKRWSGHGMEITPSDWGWKVLKDASQFWFLCAFIPITVIATIINLRANPELSEIPEGYEPRHWEYYKHPLSRFMARYVFVPMETDFEMILACDAELAENTLMQQTAKKIQKVMSFYNDHRSKFFVPFYGEFYRTARDHVFYQQQFTQSDPGEFIDRAYNPDTYNIPVEGFKPTD